MDVRLPSGVLLKGVPEGTSKDEIKRKAIAAGLATEADFGVQEPSPQQMTGEVPVLPEQQAMVPQEPVQAAPERTMGERATGVVETLGALGTGAVFGTAGHIAGTGQGLLESIQSGKFGTYEGANLVQQRSMEGAGRLTYKPTTEAGQEYTQAVGEALAPVGGAMAGLAPVSTGVGRAISQSAKSAAQVPGAVVPERLAQTRAGQAITNRIERAATPAAEATVQRQAAQVGPQPEPVIPQRQIPKVEAIKQNSIESVGYKLNPETGKPIANMLERDLVDKYKIEPRTILATREIVGPTKRPSLAMLDIAERYLKGKTETRPNKVIGDVFIKPFSQVLKKNREAGKMIDQIADDQLKGKRVDASNAFNTFERELADMGVRFDGKGKPIFQGSELAGNKVVGQISRIYDWIGDRNRVDALMLREPRTMQDGLKLHRMKRYIDRQIEWGSDISEPLDKKAVLVLKNLRRNINEELKKVSDDYAKQNAIYAETIEPIGRVTDVLGRRFDPDSEMVADYVGDQLRKTLSNYGVRVDMIEAIDSLENVAKKYGVDTGEKVTPLIRLYSDLQGKVDSFAPNSLQGIGEKVMDQGISKLGTMGEMGKAGYEAAKRRSSFYETQDIEKLKLLELMRRQIEEQGQ